jgi:hypothetical protein
MRSRRSWKLPASAEINRPATMIPSTETVVDTTRFTAPASPTKVPASMTRPK